MYDNSSYFWQDDDYLHIWYILSFDLNSGNLVLENQTNGNTTTLNLKTSSIGTVMWSTNGGNKDPLVLIERDDDSFIIEPKSISSLITGKYEHNIRVYNSSSNISVTFKFINSENTTYGYSTLCSKLYYAQFQNANQTCNATGIYVTGGNSYLIIGVYGSSSGNKLYIRYLPISGSVSSETTTYITLTSSFTVQDKAIRVN